jgi:RecJ-like exonuclease
MNSVHQCDHCGGGGRIAYEGGASMRCHVCGGSGRLQEASPLPALPTHTIRLRVDECELEYTFATFDEMCRFQREFLDGQQPDPPTQIRT